MAKDPNCLHCSIVSAIIDHFVEEAGTMQIDIDAAEIFRGLAQVAAQFAAGVPEGELRAKLLEAFWEDIGEHIEAYENEPNLPKAHIARTH